MKSENGDLIVNTLEKIFDKNEQLLNKRKQFKADKEVSVIDLEVALTVLLVDLASCDQEFDQQEYQVISKGLRRMFGTSKEDVTKLVNQATLVLTNLRGTNRFVELLKDNLDPEEKEMAIQIIDEIIMADGVEDGFETYLRAKFISMLGVEVH